MRNFWLVVSLAVCSLLVTSVLPALSLGGARPDLFLMFALAAAFVGRGDRALWAAWATGLAKDLLTEGPLGAHALLFLLMALAILRLRPYFFVGLLHVQLLLTALACAGCQTLYFIALFVYHPQMGVVGPLGYVALVTALTAGLMPFVMRGAEAWMRFLNIAPRPGAVRW